MLLSSLHDTTLSVLSMLVHTPWLTSSATVLCALLAYYYVWVVKVPELIGKPSSLWHKFLHRRLPILNEKYWCSAWCCEARMQTIAATLLTSTGGAMKYKREILQLSDGGQVSLDWMVDVVNPGPTQARLTAKAQADSKVASSQSFCDGNELSAAEMDQSQPLLDSLDQSAAREKRLVQSQRSTEIITPPTRKDLDQSSSSEDSGFFSDQSTTGNESAKSRLRDSSPSVDEFNSSQSTLLQNAKNSADPRASMQDSLRSSKQSSTTTSNDLTDESKEDLPPEIDVSANSERTLDAPQNSTENPIKNSERSYKENVPTASPEPHAAAPEDGGFSASDEFAKMDDKYPITDRPILMILPGLTGSSESEYVKDFVLAGQRSGFKCVVFNNRGKGGVPLKTTRTYCAANCDDFAEAMERIVERYRRERQQQRNWQQQRHKHNNRTSSASSCSNADDTNTDEPSNKCSDDGSKYYPFSSNKDRSYDSNSSNATAAHSVTSNNGSVNFSRNGDGILLSNKDSGGNCCSSSTVTRNYDTVSNGLNSCSFNNSSSSSVTDINYLDRITSSVNCGDISSGNNDSDIGSRRHGGGGGCSSGCCVGNTNSNIDGSNCCQQQQHQLDDGKDRYVSEDPMIVAVGISLGGMILCHYISSAATRATATVRLTAAVGVSVPYNVFLGTESLEKPWLNLALNTHLAKCLVDSVVELKYMLQDSDKWDYDHVLKAKTIREFDSRFTSVQFGFCDVNAYYTGASLHEKMAVVRVPYLGLSAADDPFQPKSGLPISQAQSSDHVALCVTSRGGHIGFLEGVMAGCWSARLVQQLLTAVIDNPGIMSTIRGQ